MHMSTRLCREQGLVQGIFQDHPLLLLFESGSLKSNPELTVWLVLSAPCWGPVSTFLGWNYCCLALPEFVQIWAIWPDCLAWLALSPHPEFSPHPVLLLHKTNLIFCACVLELTVPSSHRINLQTVSVPLKFHGHLQSVSFWHLQFLANPGLCFLSPQMPFLSCKWSGILQGGVFTRVCCLSVGRGAEMSGLNCSSEGSRKGKGDLTLSGGYVFVFLFKILLCICVQLVLCFLL